MDHERVQVRCSCKKCQRLFDVDTSQEAKGIILIKCPYCKKERRVCLQDIVEESKYRK